MRLTRMHKPIGIFLLLWPTLWALWLASAGHPDTWVLTVFVTGVILMRSAGCVMNDIADRNVDGHVERTRERPLAAKKISVTSALVLFFVLISGAFLLVLTCNTLTIQLAFLGAGLTVIYPFLKRYTHLPQLWLGVTFTWGIPMAFAAQTGSVPLTAWFLFLSSTVWPVMYDTLYGMADRADDVKIGVKSLAILCGRFDRRVITLLQLLFLSLMFVVGQFFQLQPIYYFSLFIVSGFFIYQQWLIKDRDAHRCFHAFLNNNWVGGVIFLGIVLSYFQ